MLPYTPILATRHHPRRAIAVALGLGLGLVVAAMLRVGPTPTRSPGPTRITSVPTYVPVTPTYGTRVRVAPSVNAADLVGIYRSSDSDCMLTLDASGTYDNGCSGVHGKRYAVAGEDVVLEQPRGDATQRFAISKGRLVADDGTVYSITGGVR